MTAKHGLWLAVVLFLAGIACLVAFNLIGSQVDENGVLREPFALVPLGYFLFLLSVFVGLGSATAHLFSKRRP